ncbi:MAG: DUF4198 domain-containing protein [Parahaliea sp.]
MKMIIRTVSITLLAVAVSLPVQAHRAWILPAATVLSSEDPWVSFDAVVSNEIFHPDHFPLRVESIAAQGPDGGEVPLQNPHTGKHRSNFDLQLTQPGTYRVYTAMGGLNARWEDADGKRHFWPPRGEKADPSQFDKAVPKKAKNLQVSQSYRRVETFVTAGEPTPIKAVNEGLELVAVTHPNDLYAGEKATFKFLINAKAAKGTKVSIIPGGSRYRDSQEEIALVSDEEGLVSVTWPAAGVYFLEAEYSDDDVQAPATIRRGTYTVTLEVLPL